MIPPLTKNCRKRARKVDPLAGLKKRIRLACYITLLKSLQYTNLNVFESILGT